MRPWVWVLGSAAALGTVIACVGSDPSVIDEGPGAGDASIDTGSTNPSTTDDGTDLDASTDGTVGSNCGYAGEACCTGPFAACTNGTGCDDAGLCMANDVWVVGAIVDFSDFQYHGYTARYGGRGWDAGPGMNVDGGAIPWGLWVPTPKNPILVERYGGSPYQGRVLIYNSSGNTSWLVCGDFGCLTPPRTKPFYAIYGFNGGDYWLAASDTVYHCDGATCTTRATGLPASIPQSNFAGSSSTDLWYCGFDRMYHYDGTSWTTTSGLQARYAWARAQNDVWIGDTTLQHWSGATWSPQYTLSGAPVPGNIFSISGSATDDVWAVGYNGSDGAHASFAAHWNGTAWTLVPFPAGAADVTSVWSASKIEAYASSQNGTLYRWNGTAWSVSPRPVAPDGGYLGGGWEQIAGSATPRP